MKAGAVVLQRMFQTLLGISAILVLAGCANLARIPEGSSQIAVQSIPLSPDQALRIDVAAGSVQVTGVPGDTATVQGSIDKPAVDEFSVETTSNQVLVAVIGKDKTPSGSARLEIEAPAGHPLIINCDQASIEISDFRGKVDARTVSGDITLQNVSGEVLLKNSRGITTVNGGSGAFSVAAELGAVDLEGVRGSVSAMAIMGKVTYRGSPGSGDQINLEDDHTGVDVRLDRASDVALEIHTVSGPITCLIPDFKIVTGSCSGTLGEGSGKLTIRTVTGAIGVYYKEEVPQ